MASTASTILVLFDCAVFTADVFVFTSEITRMTGGTIDCTSSRGSIFRVRIWKRTAYGRAMAAVAARIASVVARVASTGTVTEAGRCPAVGCVTHVALLRRA